MNTARTHFDTKRRGTAAFELIAVVSIASLISAALIPLLRSSVEIQEIHQTLLPDKQESYLFDMEAASMGIITDSLPAQLIEEDTESGESTS